jgi:hypothetical protein
MTRNLILIISCILCSTSLFSQNKVVISEKGITKITTYEQRLDKGLDKKFVVSEISYNSIGKITEQKFTSRKGVVKEWTKFKYNSNGNEIEEQTLNPRGDVEKRVVTIYKDQLKTSREFYDSEGRLYRKKTYEYEFGK